MKKTKYAPIRAPDVQKQVPIKKPYHAVRSIIRHKKAIVVGLKDYINFLFYNSKLQKIMRQLFLIAVLFVFALTTAFVTASTSENTDPFRKGTPLSTEDVRILRSGDSPTKRKLINILTGGDSNGGSTALIVVCYANYNNGEHDDCFPVFSLNECGTICDDPQEDSCTCYDDF